MELRCINCKEWLRRRLGVRVLAHPSPRAFMPAWVLYLKGDGDCGPLSPRGEGWGEGLGALSEGRGGLWPPLPSGRGMGRGAADPRGPERSEADQLLTEQLVGQVENVALQSFARDVVFVEHDVADLAERPASAHQLPDAGADRVEAVVGAA